MGRRLLSVVFAALVLTALPLSPLIADDPDGFVIHDANTGIWRPIGGPAFYFGKPGDLPVLCDWDGDGVDTVGLFRPSSGNLFLRNTNSQGYADVTIHYGVPGDRPVCGDWDGNGTETIGVLRPATGTFFLRNSNTLGYADLTFKFGSADDRPFAGDFDGDGIDTVGVRNPSGFTRLANVRGAQIQSVYFGEATDQLLVGDWDGDGRDSLGVNRQGRILLVNSMTYANPDYVYQGTTQGMPIAARWTFGVIAPPPPPPPTPQPPVGAAPVPPAAQPPLAPPLQAPSAPATFAPQGSVELFPGDNIQAAVNSHGSGTVFFLNGGTYSGQSVRPKSGQTFIGQRGQDGERLAILDGAGAVAEAFTANAVGGVTVRGLSIRNYGAGNRASSAINTRFPAEGRNWLIEDNEVSYSVSGIFAGSANRVAYNYVHHNSRYGITGAGDGLLVEGNEIANNRTDAGWDAGDSSATKFVLTTDLVLRNNWVHDNQGHGIWLDINNFDSLVEHNTVNDNWWVGIFHEISYNAVNRYNQVKGNGFRTTDPFAASGITVSNSPNIEIYGNTLEANAGGIIGRQWDHPSDRESSPLLAPMYGERVLRNLSVHDNYVDMSRGWHGIEPYRWEVFNTWGNTFYDNEYRLSSPGIKVFRWNGEAMTLESWRASGHN